MRLPLPHWIFLVIIFLSHFPYTLSAQVTQTPTQGDFLLSTDTSLIKISFYESQNSTLRVNIFNRNGELVHSESNPPVDRARTKFKLDIAPLPPGQYTIELNTPTVQAIRSIVIDH